MVAKSHIPPHGRSRGNEGGGSGAFGGGGRLAAIVPRCRRQLRGVLAGRVRQPARRGPNRSHWRVGAGIYHTALDVSVAGITEVGMASITFLRKLQNLHMINCFGVTASGIW